MLTIIVLGRGAQCGQRAVIYGGQLWSKAADGCLDAAALSLALHS